MQEIFLMMKMYLNLSDLIVPSSGQDMSKKNYLFSFLQIQETGEPEIVRGSYRINLPDGRTQVVNYEVG